MNNKKNIYSLKNERKQRHIAEYFQIIKYNEKHVLNAKIYSNVGLTSTDLLIVNIKIFKYLAYFSFIIRKLENLN